MRGRDVQKFIIEIFILKFTTIKFDLIEKSENIFERMRLTNIPYTLPYIYAFFTIFMQSLTALNVFLFLIIQMFKLYIIFLHESWQT